MPYIPKPYKGKTRFFDNMPLGQKKAVLYSLYHRAKLKKNMNKLRPFLKRKIYNAFYKGCYFFAADNQSLINEEFSLIQEFSVFINTIKYIKVDRDRVDVLRDYKDNPLVNYYIRSCYDPYTLRIFYDFDRNFKCINPRECVSKFFISSFTKIEELFYDETISAEDKIKHIMTYIVFYGKNQEIREALMNFVDNSGFISVKKEKINEAIGESLINDFRIRHSEKMLPRELLRKLGNVEDYFVVKRPLGVRAYAVIDGIGRANVFVESRRQNEFVRLKQKYVDTINDQFKDFKNIVFECFVSTIDEDENLTKNINAQYMSNQRRLKKYNMDNVHIFVYDILTFEEYKKGYCDITYDKRREKIENLFKNKKYENIHICEGTQLKDKEHLINFSFLAQEFDGKDYWDGLQFISKGKYDVKDNIFEIFTRSYIEKTYNYYTQACINKEIRLNKCIEKYRKNRQSLTCL